MTSKQNTAIILLSTGSPKSLKPRHIASYLSQFLNDRRIITIPAIFRFILVNFIIVPLRTFSAQKRYKQIWTEKGSPLISYTHSLKEKMQAKLGTTADVHMAMCFGSHPVNKLLKYLEKARYDKIVLVPMFPQYASSSTGAALEKVLKPISKWKTIPEIYTINSFYNDPLYVETIGDKIKKYNLKNYDKIVFTYHSVPKSHLPKDCRDCIECKHIRSNYCYRNDCYKTTKLIAKYLNLDSNKYITTFQSQLNNNWIEPFTDKFIEKSAKLGEKLLIVSPSFVTDCLESTLELGVECKDIYQRNGGKLYTLVDGLNDDSAWVKALLKIVKLE